MNVYARAFLAWLSLAVAVTGVCLLVYATVQQNYRQSLNDPQIQMAEDAARSLNTEYTPAAVVPRGQAIDIAASLSPWIAVYDSSHKPLESDAVLDGAPPKPPQGVFDMTAAGAGKDSTRPDENRISWQPRNGVRQAIVVVQLANNRGFVVAGRGMREVEEREGQLSTLVILGWLVTLATSLVATLVGALLAKRF